MLASRPDSESDWEFELSVVVPVYFNTESLPAVLERISEFAAEITKLEAVFVIDGGADGASELLTAMLPDCGFPSQLIEHSRNFGSFAAIKTGFRHARGRITSVMAADLQEPAHLIPDFYRALCDSQHDIAIAVRSERHDGNLVQAASGTYWRLYRALVQPSMPPGGIDVFACNSLAREALLRFNESHSSLVGQLLWIGYDVVEIPYVRQAREVGVSQWTFRKKWKYMVDSVFSFTSLPITLMLWIGFIGTTVITIASITVAIAWLAGRIPVLGYTPIMLTVLFAAFLIQTSLGIIGTYVWRAYENTKQRPGALVSAHMTFAKSASSAESNHE